MSAYVIIELDVHDSDRYARYREMVPPTLEAYGGRFLVRGGGAELLEGEGEPKRVVVLEFDSVARAKDWWASELYAPAKALRMETSTARLIVVEGV